VRAACLCAASAVLCGLPWLAPAADAEPERVDLTLRDAGRDLTNSLGMRFRHVPAGTFMMGAPEGDADAAAHEKPRHEVEITKAFYLGVHEVTQKQFRAVMGYNPSYFSRDGKLANNETYGLLPRGGMGRVKEVADSDLDDFPVENVSWSESQKFLDKLNARPEERRSRRTYRLPSEAEWEYACRAGAKGYRKWHTGDELPDKLANHDNRLRRTSKVGSYPANDFGIHDMHGNAWEWCADWYGEDYYAASPRRDPQGPAKGGSRVLRGGCWNGENGRGSTRSAYRLSWGPDQRNYDTGFRVVLVEAR
jgi:formylglycine-generating enzyme required for sulfatase activity